MLLHSEYGKSQTAIILDKSDSTYKHGNSFLFSVDAEQKFSSASFGKQEFENSFKPASDKDFNFGLTSTAIWFKLRLVNVTNEQ